jgi:hypothetical protein
MIWAPEPHNEVLRYRDQERALPGTAKPPDLPCALPFPSTTREESLNKAANHSAAGAGGRRLHPKRPGSRPLLLYGPPVPAAVVTSRPALVADGGVGAAWPAPGPRGRWSGQAFMPGAAGGPGGRVSWSARGRWRGKASRSGAAVGPGSECHGGPARRVPWPALVPGALAGRVTGAMASFSALWLACWRGGPPSVPRASSWAGGAHRSWYPGGYASLVPAMQRRPGTARSSARMQSRVAQLAERPAVNRQVAGSSPAAGAQLSGL